MQPVQVFSYTTIENLAETKNAFENPERMLDKGTHTRLGFIFCF
jgi:hypothetical protein